MFKKIKGQLRLMPSVPELFIRLMVRLIDFNGDEL